MASQGMSCDSLSVLKSIQSFEFGRNKHSIGIKDMKMYILGSCLSDETINFSHLQLPTTMPITAAFIISQTQRGNAAEMSFVSCSVIDIPGFPSPSCLRHVLEEVRLELWTLKWEAVDTYTVAYFHQEGPTEAGRAVFIL